MSAMHGIGRRVVGEPLTVRLYEGRNNFEIERIAEVALRAALRGDESAVAKRVTRFDEGSDERVEVAKLGVIQHLVSLLQSHRPDRQPCAMALA